MTNSVQTLEKTNFEALKVGYTHNGPFHADETFATALLKLLYGEDFKVVRTRNPQILNEALTDENSIVYDVGNGDFDHHAEGSVKFRENGIPYSSFGLIWNEIGKMLIDKLYGLSEEDTEKMFKAFDSSIVQGIDAKDNGMNTLGEGALNVTYDLSSMIGSFVPSWNEDTDLDTAFANAVVFAKTIVLNQLNKLASGLQAKNLVEVAFENRKDGIVIFDQFVPWQGHLLKMDTEEEVKFALFPDISGSWRIQAVPKESGSFETRLSLLADWAGKDSATLNTLIGINDAIFCHAARFIAGAESKESVIKMARLSLEQ